MKRLIAVVLAATLASTSAYAGFLTPTPKAPSAQGLAAFLTALSAKGISDLQNALALANSPVPGSVTATAPNGTPSDPVGAQCYQALITFVQTLPPPPKPGTVVGLATQHEFLRIAGMQLKTGIPSALKIGCAPMVVDDVAVYAGIAVMVGIAFPKL